jgi:hypothetical protein
VSTAATPDSIQSLVDFIATIPAIKLTDTPSRGIGAGADEHIWWVKFGIDIDHPLAWHVVQELGHVLNLVSLDERLPTVFKPVSPPPYMNGGPDDFLSWVIECPIAEMAPAEVRKWLEGRLPRPIDDLSAWADEE